MWNRRLTGGKLALLFLERCHGGWGWGGQRRTINLSVTSGRWRRCAVGRRTDEWLRGWKQKKCEMVSCFFSNTSAEHRSRFWLQRLDGVWREVCVCCNTKKCHNLNILIWKPTFCLTHPPQQHYLSLQHFLFCQTNNHQRYIISNLEILHEEKIPCLCLAELQKITKCVFILKILWILRKSTRQKDDWRGQLPRKLASLM